MRPGWIVALLVVAPAAASSPAAWAAHDAAAKRACVKASGLLNATTSSPIGFSDTVGQTAMLVRGTFPQRFMKGKTGTYLCLYDRRTKRAEASEAAGVRFQPA